MDELFLDSASGLQIEFLTKKVLVDEKKTFM